MRIPLGTQWTVTTTNDGSVYLSRKGQHTDSDRYGTVPLISLEVSTSSNRNFSVLFPFSF